MTAEVVSLDPGHHKPFTLVVAAKVRGRMAEMGYRQSELAGVLGLSQQSASKRLTGKVPFDVNELAATAAWLGCSVVALLGDAGTTPPQGPGHVPAQSAGTYTDTARRVLDLFRPHGIPRQRTLVPLTAAA
jgi:transcriptional regulator with XRE-family HTH domain